MIKDKDSWTPWEEAQMVALFPTREPVSSQDVGRALHSPTVAWVPDVTGSGLSPSTLGTEEVAPAHILYEPLPLAVWGWGGRGGIRFTPWCFCTFVLRLAGNPLGLEWKGLGSKLLLQRV